MASRPEFNPMDGMDQEDIAHLNDLNKAKDRHAKAWGIDVENDESRAAAAEEHRRTTMAAAGVLPGDMEKQGLTPMVAPAKPAEFIVLRASPSENALEIPSAGEQFGTDWDSIKSKISKHEGSWDVREYRFPMNVPLILGFFKKEGWDAPEDSEKRLFEVIVKGGRVFRTDPE